MNGSREREPLRTSASADTAFGGYGLPDWLADSVISVPVIEQRTKEFFRQLET